MHYCTAITVLVSIHKIGFAFGKIDFKMTKELINRGLFEIFNVFWISLRFQYPLSFRFIFCFKNVDIRYELFSKFKCSLLLEYHFYCRRLLTINIFNKNSVSDFYSIKFFPKILFIYHLISIIILIFGQIQITSCFKFNVTYSFTVQISQSFNIIMRFALNISRTARRCV